MLKWLAAELKATVEPDDSARFALDLSNQRVTLIEQRMGRIRELGAALHDSDDFHGDVEALRRMVARKRGAQAPVDLLLPEELTLFRIETFPAEARQNLRDEAWWRLDLITPYRPEELFYDVALLGVEPNTGFLEVHIAIAPREIAEEAIQYARAWGFQPQRVSAPGPAEGFPHGPVFVQAAQRGSETRTLRSSALVMATAALALAVIGVTRGVWERQALADALEAQQTAAESVLKEAQEARDATLSLAGRAIQPAMRRAEGRSALAWLDALAAALPTEAVTDRVMLGDGVLRLEGSATNADAVLAALATTDAFTLPRYAAPVTRGESERGHRFAIEASLGAPKGAAP